MNKLDNLTANSQEIVTIEELNSIIDKDNSIDGFNLINDYSDNAYIVFKLPSSIRLTKYDQLIITLIPCIGNQKIIELQAPFSIKPVFSF